MAPRFAPLVCSFLALIIEALVTPNDPSPSRANGVILVVVSEALEAAI